MPDQVRLLTWNLLGSQRPDLDVVTQVLRERQPDVVVLQEVQRRQARSVADALGGWGRRWAFKHWPVRVPAEGMAVLTPHRITRSRRVVLRRAPLWSWRRRIALFAEVTMPGWPLVLANVHLTPHGDGPGRVSEVERLEALLRAWAPGMPTVVIGDLNDHPGGPAHAALLAGGRQDAWARVHGDEAEPAGATNWTAGPRRGRPPTQRLDHALVPAGWRVVAAEVVGLGQGDALELLGEVSDHLPLVVDLGLGDREVGEGIRA